MMYQKQKMRASRDNTTRSRIIRLCFMIRRQLEPINLYLTGMTRTYLIGYEITENNEIVLFLRFFIFSLVNGVTPKFSYHLTLNDACLRGES